MDNKWIYSLDEDYWKEEKEFNTKEEAIKALREEKHFSLGGWVGKKNIVDKEYMLSKATLFDIDNFNDDAEEFCTDEGCYLQDSVNNKQKAEELREIMAEFIIKNFDTNLSYMVKDIEEIKEA